MSRPLPYVLMTALLLALPAPPASATTVPAARTKPVAHTPSAKTSTLAAKKKPVTPLPAAHRGDTKRVCYRPGAACELAEHHGGRSRGQDRERSHDKAKPPHRPARRSLGVASYYGPGFENRPTANGERFDPSAMTAAHRSLPFGTRVRVTNLGNGRQVVVRINDRGPYRKGRLLDLSRAAARKLGFLEDGIAHVRIEVLKDRKARRNRDHLTDDMQASREGTTRTRSKSRA